MAGATKMVSVHSLLWDSDSPWGRGHPDVDDMALRKPVHPVLDRVRVARVDLPLAALDCQSDEVAVAFKVNRAVLSIF